MLGKAFVEHGELGFHGVGRGKVRIDQFTQERLGFLHHEPLQSPIELGKQFFVGLGEVHVPQVQPRLREIGQKAVEPPVLEQALGFLAQSSGIVGQFGLESQAEQFPLRQGPIKKKRQSVREGQIVEASRHFTQVKEVGGREQGGEDRPQGTFETFLLLTLVFEKREVGGKVLIGHGPTEGVGGQALDRFGGIGGFVLRDDLEPGRVPRFFLVLGVARFDFTPHEIPEDQLVPATGKFLDYGSLHGGRKKGESGALVVMDRFTGLFA